MQATRRPGLLPAWVAPLAALCCAVLALALWWQHYPLVRAVDALHDQVGGVTPLQLQSLRVHRATGAGCGRLVLQGGARRSFVVTSDGSVLLEPLELHDGTRQRTVIASLGAWKDFWRTARTLCPDPVH